jgi:transcriptional regulator with XRE-family HTH domain
MKTTLSSSFAEFRQERHLTLLAIAKKCDIAETTVFKVEQGRPVRWETLHLILTVGMKLPPKSDRYAEFHRLWLLQRSEMARNRPKDSGKKKLTKHAAAAVKAFRNIIRDLDEPATRKAVLAAGNVAKKALLK